nr:hypothetical protein [Pseudoroseomonas wenyumeiae]
MHVGGFLVARLPPRPSCLLALLGRRGLGLARNSHRRLDGAVGRHLSPNPSEHGVVPLHHRLDGIAEITEQVPAVGGLHGTRRALASAIRVGAGTVAGDDLHAWVLPQPVAQGLGLAIWQEIKHPVAL